MSRDTVNEWQRVHAEFSDAVRRGKAARTMYLEGGLLAAPDGPKVTSRIFALKNADPDEWREKRDVQVTGADGGPINHSLSVEFVKPEDTK